MFEGRQSLQFTCRRQTECRHNSDYYAEKQLLFTIFSASRRNIIKRLYVIKIVRTNRIYSFYFFMSHLIKTGWWLVVLGSTALLDSVSVYIGPSPKERDKEERKIEESENAQTIPSRTCCKRSRSLPYFSYLVGRPGPERLPSTIAPPNHPRFALHACYPTLKVNSTLTVQGLSHSIFSVASLSMGVNS